MMPQSMKIWRSLTNYIKQRRFLTLVIAIIDLIQIILDLFLSLIAWKMKDKPRQQMFQMAKKFLIRRQKHGNLQNSLQRLMKLQNRKSRKSLYSKRAKIFQSLKKTIKISRSVSINLSRLNRGKPSLQTLRHPNNLQKIKSPLTQTQ